MTYMRRKKVVRISTLILMAFLLPATVFSETAGVFYDSKIEQIKFAAGDVQRALESIGFRVEMLPLSALKQGYGKKKVVIALTVNADITKLLAYEGGAIQV